MNTVFEKLNFLRENGHAHFFNVGDVNFLYNREYNSTYQVDEKVYKSLGTEPEPSSQESEALDMYLYYSFKRDIKPTINLYSLFVLDKSEIESHIQEIKGRCFTYGQSDIIFSERTDTTGEVAIEKIKSLLNLSKSDLMLIIEKNVSSFDAVIDDSNDYKNGLRNIHYVNKSQIANGIDIKKILGQTKIEYSAQHENEIYKCIINGKGNISLFIDKEQDLSSFVSFLLALLEDKSGAYRGIFNFNSVINFLISKLNFNRTIETFNNGVFSEVNNIKCDKCWAKNICWSTKTFSSFGIDLFNVDKYKAQCDSIKQLFEQIILKVRTIEKSKKNRANESYDFEGNEVKLIN